jgi:DNA ligase-1
MEKTIYKKDSSGNIRYLCITTEGNIVVQESGIFGTNSPVFNRSACEAKNVGKANATTPEEQAVSEAHSKINEKMRLGYFNSIEEAQQKGGKDFLLPMLAKDFKKESKKVTYPCYVQPKLDGMRSLGTEDDGFMSRTGKSIDTLDHIVLSGFEGAILDGELYAHGISFQETMKLIKKYRRGETEQIKYHVYDMVMDAPFAQRYEKLCDIVMHNPNIEIVPTHVINSLEELAYYHTKFLSEGYEGTMVRHSYESYAVNKRSSQLLKYKDFLDEAYEVIDVVPSESRPEQGVVVCIIRTSRSNDPNVISQPQTFNCGMKFSHFERKMILEMKHEYIGQMAEVRFFEYTDGGIPRFPVCVGFRLDK